MVTTLRGMGQSVAEGGGSGQVLFVVFRLPLHLLAVCSLLLVDDGSVQDDRGRGVSLVEGRGVDDRLDRRAGHAVGLKDAVELAAGEIVPSDHGLDLAGMGVESHQCALGLWLLLQGQPGAALLRPRIDSDLQEGADGKSGLVGGGIARCPMAPANDARRPRPLGLGDGDRPGDRAQANEKVPAAGAYEDALQKIPRHRRVLLHFALLLEQVGVGFFLGEDLEGSAVTVALVEVAQVFLHRLLGGLLHRQVHGGMYLPARRCRAFPPRRYSRGSGAPAR